MDLDNYKKLFVELARDYGYKIYDLKGIDCFLPFLQDMKNDTAVVIIKLDGERKENIYTFIVLSENLKGVESIRLDTSNLEGGLSYICVEYAKIAWGWKAS